MSTWHGRALRFLDSESQSFFRPSVDERASSLRAGLLPHVLCKDQDFDHFRIRQNWVLFVLALCSIGRDNLGDGVVIVYSSQISIACPPYFS